MAPLAHSSASSAAPGVGQGSLDFSPRRRPAGARAVDPALRLALGLLLHSRHEGRANAATWEQLRQELAAQGLEVKHVRRLQEAASVLRREDKMPIGATSGGGVYYVADDTDRRLAAAERVKRIRAEVRELEAFDRALYEQIAGALPLEEDRAA
jgi:hypothetical protein